MRDQLFELTETYTIPLSCAIVTVTGLVQPWLPMEFKEVARVLIGF